MPIRECCGLFGVWGDPDAARLTYMGLFALQHRGQESAGIAVARGGRLEIHRGMGLVSEVFKARTLKKLESHAAVGHVRYSTTGLSDLRNAQPLPDDPDRPWIAVAHNGNLVNTQQIRSLFENAGRVLPNMLFHTSTDTELILLLIGRQPRDGIRRRIRRALRELRGAFSLLFLTPDGMAAVRDPSGFRPLCLGRKGTAWAVASESCAFDITGFELVRDIAPGEMIWIGPAGKRSERVFPKHALRRTFCMFEHVYFARPDSKIDGDTVQSVRKRLGRQLARVHPVEADVVTPIPDSGNEAALGFARESGIPFEFCFIRNHYIGRTFIEPEDHQRQADVRIKLAAVREAVKGRRIVVVDDSIVRGNTVRNRIHLLRDAGAKEIHLRISCPPIRHPCFYGIDFPTRSELIATDRTVDEIRRYVGADSLGFLPLEAMLSCVSRPASEYCTACWSGEYPVEVTDEASKYRLETR